MDNNTILLVEDEMTLRELYEELLGIEGYKVDSASDGDTALEKITAGNWDLLLLDIMLPKLDGLQILKKIKDNEKINKKPIVIISNLDSGNIVQECLKNGAVEYVIKSNINPQHLVDIVAKYISNAKH